MEKIVTCGDLGMDCPFEATGLTDHETLMRIMKHVQTVHTRDWFELEEIHTAAHALLRNGAG